MSKDIFARGVLTDDLLDYLEQTFAAAEFTLLVGDHLAPEEGGWSGGQPGTGEFVPYLVLTTGPATRNAKDPIGRDNSSWSAAYTLRAVGATRTQADWAADMARSAVVGYAKRKPEGLGGWKVQLTLYSVLGDIQRNNSVDPPYYELTDTVALWLEAPMS